MRRWEVERNSAKCERRKARWTKPKMPVTEKMIPKPKVADFEEESEEMEGDEEEEHESAEEDGIDND